ncbi:glycosyltransferase [Bacillus paranthracis]|uniref:glycosyltransferase n=1 Tax=Bacillus cereus group TaxID=86661 RepID=UPI0009459629|nr:glycosyltransferase [Bacillus cereus]
MKILYFVSIDEKNKTGLFNATHARIKVNSDKFHHKIYNLNFYDSFFLKILKKILGKKVLRKEKECFIYDGIEYNNMYIKETVVSKLMGYFGVDSLLYLNFLFQNKKLVKEYDLISAHWGHHPGSIAYFVKKAFRIPYVVTWHGSDIHTLPREQKYKKIILRNLKGASQNIFVSSYLLEEAKKIGYNLSQNKIIYNGVNFNHFQVMKKSDKEMIKKDLGIEGKVIGYVGNLVHIKGVDRLPKILGKVIEKQKDSCLLIVGDGELRDSIIKKASSYNVKTYFMGKVAPMEVQKYINIMDVMILPSRKEGLPCVLLEAQACGTHVVGSSNGGIPEAILDRNCIVKDDDEFEEQFASKILEVLSSKDESINCIEDLQGTFDWVKGGGIEYSLYKEIIKMNRT